MRKTESRASSKRSVRSANNISSFDLHSICVRLNEIIERSNSIDNQLSEYENKIIKNKITPISIQEEPISEYGLASPGSKHQSKISSPLKSITQTTISDINDLTPKVLTTSFQQDPITKISDNSNYQENQISLNDIYRLVLDLKQQVTEIAKNQKVMQEEIKRLRAYQ